jgi:hypothetical protein
MFIRVGVISGVLVASGKAGKEDSLSALQSAAGIGRAVVTSGSQLEVTKKLQQTLGDTIMQSITNSDPKAMERIKGDFVKVLTDQVAAMKTAVNDENTESQTDIETKLNVFKTCNTRKETKFTSGDEGPVGPTPCAGMCFGWGGDISTFDGLEDGAACQGKCVEDERCGTWYYDSTIQFCWLKCPFGDDCGENGPTKRTTCGSGQFSGTRDCSNPTEKGLPGPAGSPSVNSLNSKLHTARLSHADCRGEEQEAIGNRNDKCNAAQSDADIAGSDRPGCMCSKNLDKKDRLACMAESKTWVEGHLADLHAAVTLCNATIKIDIEKQAECDGAQGNFEAAECAYSMELEDTCLDLDSCHADALIAYNGEVERVQLKEVSHKELLTAITHVECLIGLFGRAKTDKLVKEDVAKCLDDIIDTSGLDVDYGVPAAKVVCDKSTAIWNATEYAAFSAIHINPLADCVRTFLYY